MATSLGEPRRRPLDRVRERFWNVPNTITVVRTAVVPVLVAFPLFDGPTGSRVVAWLFIAAALGDALDGWAARRGQQVTRIGKLLDPLADKLAVTTALIVLLMLERIPAWGLVLVVVIVGRELAVTGLRGIASAGGHVVAASPAGKIKALAQNVAIACLLFPDRTLALPNHEMGVALLTVATALTLWSGYAYFADYFSAEPTHPEGGSQESKG
jgi:CDP-diacylglycerol---glycerol-3-phosphate 3-phosphatidyltransferase